MAFFSDDGPDSASLEQSAKTIKNFSNGFAAYSAFSNIALQAAANSINNTSGIAAAQVAQNQRAQQFLNIRGQQDAALAANGVAGGNTARLYAMRANIQNQQAEYAINARRLEEKTAYKLASDRAIGQDVSKGFSSLASLYVGVGGSGGGGLFGYAKGVGSGEGLASGAGS